MVGWEPDTNDVSNKAKAKTNVREKMQGKKVKDPAVIPWS